VNPDGETTALLNEIRRLRNRLENLETQHAETVRLFREELSALEGKMEPVAEKPVVLLDEPLLVVAPPPLPAPAADPWTEPVAETTPVEKKGSFEMQFGRVWLVRFGIVLLLTGLVLLGNYAYQNWIREMPNGLRLTGLFACAGVLIEVGRRLAAKPATQKFGEVILAGGMSFAYYCTFAAHHVDRLRVIENPIVAALLLLIAAAAIGAVSCYRNAKTTATLGLLLASYSTMLQLIGWLSCVSNILLSGAGVFLMRRPGWAGPGVAAMVGTYAAFFGWQFLGAANGDAKNPAMLWFLPPVWLMFSLPGMIDRFRETMSDRARAWFVGGNNAAFFLLFSLLWIDRFQTENYWSVCAVIGSLLIAFGVVGRRSRQIAGDVNLSQGLLLVSGAMVVKLDGYHLALGFAVESLMLALAAARFRRKTEQVFSWLSATGSMGILLPFAFLFGDFLKFPVIPIWSAGLAALLIFAASLVLRNAAEKTAWKVGRIGTGLVFFVAVAAAISGWCFRLDDPLPLPVLTGLAMALSVGSLTLDRRNRMPEIGVGALVFLLSATGLGFFAESLWALLISGCFALIATWFWHRSDRKIYNIDVYAWAFSAASVGAVWMALEQTRSGTGNIVLWLGAAGALMIGLAIFLRTGRLALCASVLFLAALYKLVISFGDFGFPALALAGFALVTFGLLAFPWTLVRLGEINRNFTALVLRGTGFVALCLFWGNFASRFFGDGVAFLAILLGAACLYLKRPWIMEIWGFVGLGVWWLLGKFFESEWSAIAPNDLSWRGGILMLALLGITTGHRYFRSAKEREWVTGWMSGLACGMIALWATQMLVWRDDWKMTAVLWTVLGFSLVSVGLWRRLRTYRLAGFALLALAILKVFALDVWDFNAFMRVISFIVLGMALILLGLFYNRFASVLKQLLDDETNEKPVSDEGNRL